MTVLDILTRVERTGGELAIGADGRLVLRKARGVPRNLVDDIRRRKDEIRDAIAPGKGVAQLVLDLPSGDPPGLVTFLDREDARFDALLAEFGISTDILAVKR